MIDRPNRGGLSLCLRFCFDFRTAVRSVRREPYGSLPKGPRGAHRLRGERRGRVAGGCFSARKAKQSCPCPDAGTRRRKAATGGFSSASVRGARQTHRPNRGGLSLCLRFYFDFHIAARSVRREPLAPYKGPTRSPQADFHCIGAASGRQPKTEGAAYQKPGGTQPKAKQNHGIIKNRLEQAAFWRPYTEPHLCRKQ